MKKILLVSCLSLVSGVAHADDNMHATTRFGIADTSGGNLVVNGTPSSPQIHGNNALWIEKLTESGDADYLLLTDIGGAGCPALYSIAKVTASSTTPVAVFGNCSEPDGKKVIRGEKINIHFPTWQWRDFKPSKPTTFIYDIPTGTMTKDGKPLNTACKNNDCQ